MAKCKCYKPDAECARALGDLAASPALCRCCAPDAAFFTRLGKPRRGDWLSEHRETGQTFDSSGAYWGHVRAVGPSSRCGAMYALSIQIRSHAISGATYVL